MWMEVMKGESIYLATQRAIQTAQWEQEEVEFEFNDIVMSVSPNSCEEDIIAIYLLRCRLRRLENA